LDANTDVDKIISDCLILKISKPISDQTKQLNSKFQSVDLEGAKLRKQI